MNTGSTHISNAITDSPGAIANLAQHMANVTNTVTQQIDGSAASEQVKTLIKQLTDQIAALSPSLVPEKIKQMGDNLIALSAEMTKPAPRRKWYLLLLDGMKETALALGEMGKPIIDTIAMLSPLLVP